MQSSAQSDKSEGPLKVHFNISSHMDPGWIYTFEEYYQGTNTQEGGSVSALLNNVFLALQKSPTRKYSLAEISCFERWWRDQNEDRRKIFRELVKNGQFEFINGGWCANDEACAYYEDIVDNFIIGHRWLKDNLDVTTSIGWQMDSFGTSATHAGLMAQAGFEGLFFSRADFADRAQRIKDKSLQFNWMPGNPRNESVLTQMLYTQYSDTKFMIPDNFWYRSIFHKGRLLGEEYRVVADYLKKQSQSFITNNTLFLVCDDFHLWREAEKDFDGIDGMIEYFDQNPELGLKVDYSSLEQYLTKTSKDIVDLKTNNTLPEKKDDFFPYIENKYTAWTGYFTSKAMFKLMIREHSQYYNAAKLLLAKLLLSNPKDLKQHEKVNQALLSIEAPLAMTQHHDAVTGTMKEYVKRDYERMLREGRGGLDEVLQPLLTSYLEQVLGEPLKDSKVQWDWLYNDKNYLSIFSSQNVPVLVVYNPGKDRRFLIDVKVPSEEGYQVIDGTGKEIEAEIIPYDQANKDWRLFFVDDVPAYSLKVYKLVKGKNANIVKGTSLNNEEHIIEIGDKVAFTVGNDLKSFKYKYCQSGNTCVSDSFTLDYEYYESNIVQADGKVASGAYIFNPRSQEKFKYSQIESAVVYKGKYLTLLQIKRDNLRTDIKLVHHQPERGIEIESHLQPVTDFPNGKEIVLVVRSSNVKNQGVIFYTDGNGYFMQKRQKDHKDTFEFSTENGIANNYYPMTSNAYIEDTNSGQRLSIVTDRSQGMTSANPGEIEVMLHRVTLRDDWKGVSEPLQERDPVTMQMISVSTRHFLVYSNPKQGVPDMRRQQQYDLDRPVQRWFYYSNKQEISQALVSKGKEGEVVPDLVKVYVRSYKPNEYIVRLHNLDELEAKVVNIKDGFLSKFAGIEEVKVGEIVELSWTTVKLKSELKWNQLDPKKTAMEVEQEGDFTKVNLLPLEIRTFQITLQA